MKVTRGLTPPVSRPYPVATIGNFDGQHKGHRALLGMVVNAAQSTQGTPVVLTFDPHPVKILAPHVDLRFLTSPAEKLARFEEAGVQEVITVEAATPLVETGSSIRTNTVDEEAIRNLPINGRRFQDFLTLTPTAQVDTSRGQISFAGQRGINSNVSIDGADYNQPFFGGIRGGERANLASWRAAHSLTRSPQVRGDSSTWATSA